MKHKLQALTALLLLGLVVFWVGSMPHPLDAGDVPPHQPDLAKGKLLYNVGGCIACHASPADAQVPSGGKPFKTPIGVLYPPNLTPDAETGLGAWTDLQFLNAMQRGLSRDNAHLIPALPYASYAKMKPEDVLDIKAYLATLPPVKNMVPAHQIPVLPLVRRGIGLWKWLGLDTAQWKPDPGQPESWNRGAYLVNGPGHCGECHTPRNLAMAPRSGHAFEGGPHPDGTGKVPSLRGLVERGRYKDLADLVSAFQDGEIGGYEHMSSGGMGEVQTNLSKLPEADLKAIAEYLLSLK